MWNLTMTEAKDDACSSSSTSPVGAGSRLQDCKCSRATAITNVVMSADGESNGNSNNDSQTNDDTTATTVKTAHESSCVSSSSCACAGKGNTPITKQKNSTSATATNVSPLYNDDSDEDPFVYAGSRLHAIDFPLGGFGTGNVIIGKKKGTNKRSPNAWLYSVLLVCLLPTINWIVVSLFKDLVCFTLGVNSRRWNVAAMERDESSSNACGLAGQSRAGLLVWDPSRRISEEEYF